MKTIKNSIYMVKYVFKFCPVYVVSSILYIISESALALAEVILIKDVTDMIIAKNDFSDILNVIVRFVIIMGVCVLISRFHNTFLYHRYRNIWMQKIQRVMFEKARNIDVECFDDPKQYDLFSRALKNGDIKGIETFDRIVTLLRGFFTVLSVGIYIILQDVLLLIMVFLQTVISFIVNAKVSKMWYKANKDNETNWRRQSYIKRTFYLEKNTCDIKTTSLSKLLKINQIEVKDEIDTYYRKVEEKAFRYWRFEEIFYQGARNIFGYGYLMFKVFYRDLSIGLFGSTVSAINKFTNYIYWIVEGVVGVREQSMYIDDFMWLMNYKPKIENQVGKKVSSEHPVIDIKHLSFKYPSQDTYALKDISLTLRPQEKIAIIGYNGAGKTTLIKLLLKFYDLETGKISLDQREYEDLDNKEIRAQYKSIFQNFQLYSLTVLENILFRKRISEEDDKVCWDALAKSGLASKIRSLDKGLDTIVTKEFDDDGLNLSGGEKQKLAMARVFASNAPIIILDEPTSSLDPISEYEMNKKIIELCKDKTIIMISHRLSTIIDATKIYMLSNGEIIEEGCHEELMNKKGKYFEMFETQANLYREV